MGKSNLIPRDQLPEDAAEWNHVEVSFPRLDPDTPEFCPCGIDDIFQHVQFESVDLDDAEFSRLVFLRTALVGDRSYWVWSYTEADGEVDYVIAYAGSDGLDSSCCLGMMQANGLTVDQFLLADYYDEIYWP